MDSQTTRHAVVGAIVSFVFLGYAGAPFVGGGLAGYLDDQDLQSGLRVGAVAGILTVAAVIALAVPDALLRGGDLSSMDMLWEGVLDPVLEGVPVVILSLLGGGVGAYVRRETVE